MKLANLGGFGQLLMLGLYDLRHCSAYSRACVGVGNLFNTDIGMLEYS